MRLKVQVVGLDVIGLAQTFLLKLRRGTWQTQNCLTSSFEMNCQSVIAITYESWANKNSTAERALEQNGSVRVLMENACQKTLHT